jgi:hypothetical protein
MMTLPRTRLDILPKGGIPPSLGEAPTVGISLFYRSAAVGRPFLRSFIHSFVRSFIHSFIHSFVRSFVHQSEGSPLLGTIARMEGWPGPRDGRVDS